MEYKRNVDKRLIPTCNIMGVNIAAINMEWLVDYLEKNLSEYKGRLHMRLKCAYNSNQL